MPPSSDYTGMQQQQFHDQYSPTELHLVTSECYSSSARISPASTSGDLPPPKKPGRGRRRDDSLPYNRARDVQRAFRARRAAHLSNLEQRVQDLEEENAHLREALRLPPSDRPPIGTGPTGRGRLLKPTAGESQSSSGTVPDHESPPIAASTSTSTSEPSPPPSPSVPVSVNGNWMAIDSYSRPNVPPTSRMDGLTASASEREFVIRPYEASSHSREPFHDSPVSLGRGTIPPTLRTQGETFDSRSSTEHIGQAPSYHMQDTRSMAVARQDRPSDSPMAPLPSVHRAASSEGLLYGTKTHPQPSQSGFPLHGAPDYDSLYIKREQADPLFAGSASMAAASGTSEAGGYVHRRAHAETGWTERHQAYPATAQLAQPSSSYPPGHAAIPRSDPHYERWSTSSTWSAPSRPDALEKKVRAEAGEHDPAWEAAQLGNVGTLVWRVEKFAIKPWPKQRYGEFFSGDSYIVLQVSIEIITMIAQAFAPHHALTPATYKKDPNSDTLSYDLHFWLGDDTTLDEAGTAAYKTAELDDVLHGTPVQYREVMGHESTRFRSHFKRFVVLKGGVSTGFHHVEEPPIDETPRLYRIHAETAPSAGASPAKSPILVRQVDLKQPNPIESGDVYILDKGSEVWQLNTMGSPGELVAASPHQPPKLYRLSDASGAVLALTPVKPLNGTSPSKQDLSPADLFFLDCTSFKSRVLYVWIGSQSSSGERRMGLQYAQRFLQENSLPVKAPIAREAEGQETDDFIKALEYQPA
ncbi:hypothetical protein FRC00_001139 [Tulasnella sp. 408]|nr:hypothetical protein FRC00_001139 [Tulasnella sp. 408]